MRTTQTRRKNQHHLERISTLLSFCIVEFADFEECFKIVLKKKFYENFQYKDWKFSLKMVRKKSKIAESINTVVLFGSICYLWGYAMLLYSELISKISKFISDQMFTSTIQDSMRRRFAKKSNQCTCTISKTIHLNGKHKQHEIHWAIDVSSQTNFGGFSYNDSTGGMCSSIVPIVKLGNTWREGHEIVL